MEGTNLNTYQSGSTRLSGAKVLSYYELGKGVPIVFLHGIGSSGASWEGQFAELFRCFHLIAWNAPGYGESSPLACSEPASDDYAGVLREFVEALRLESFYLVGHSLGALVAGAYAKTWPEKIRGLVLVDPALGYGHAPKQVRTEKLLSRIESFRELGASGIAKTRGPKLLSPQAPEEAVARLCHIMAQLHEVGYLQASHMLANGDLLSDINAYAGRALVLCGTEDQITPPAGAKQVAAAMEQAVYRDIDGAGHASYMEAQGQFKRHLESFIQGVETIDNR